MISKTISNIFTDIADALREKLGTSASINPINFVDNINSLSVDSNFYQDATKLIDGTARVISADISYIRPSTFIDRAYYLRSVDFSKCLEIGAFAFSNCQKLSKISFPVCTTIGEGAFNYCINLSVADFPNVETIGNSAFASCSNLTSINFPALPYIADSPKLIDNECCV